MKAKIKPGTAPQADTDFNLLAAELEATNQAAHDALNQGSATGADSKSHMETVVEETMNKRSIYRDAGIANTLDNALILAQEIETFGPAYTTNNPLLTPANLLDMHAQAALLVSKVATQNNGNKVAINLRLSLFEGLPKLATRVINALIACGASKETVHDARYFVNKIQGVRVVPKSEDPTAKHISVSQQSFVQLVQHFEGLIIVLMDEPLYDPATADLTVASLSSLVNEMKEGNKDVSGSDAVLGSSRLQRNAYFDTPVTGLVAVCLAAKHNVKAIFGATSPEYLRISGLQFRRIQK